MNIYEVKFIDGKKKESAFFSSKSSAEKFILNIVDVGIHKISRPIKHIVDKTKCEIIKFLNRDNQLG
jgi:hypothetical protein